MALFRNNRPAARRRPYRRRHRLLTRPGLAWLAFFIGLAAIWLT